MSDERVRAAIEQMETWLAEPNWDPDPEALTQWNADFTLALAQAEKAAGWPDLVARAHAVGQRLEARTILEAQARDKVKAELEAQERGSRALKGYRAMTS